MKLIKYILYIGVLLLLTIVVNAQKIVHTPNIISANTSLTYSQMESDNFAVFYGDLIADIHIEEIIEVLEYSYDFYADSLNYNTSATNAVTYKFIVIIDESWSTSPSPNTANPNVIRNFDSTVDGIWFDFNTAITINELLKAHEVAHLFQRSESIINLPTGEQAFQFQFEETHAQYLAYTLFPEVNADYIARQTRSRESWLRQNPYFTYYFLLYINDKLGSLAVNGLFTNMYYREHPFKAYGRIFNKSISAVNTIFAEYAMRTVNFDFSLRNNWEAPLNSFERNGILDANFNSTTGWYDVPATSSMHSIAPEAYGFNTHEIKTYNSTSFDFEFQGTKSNDLMADYRYGFVAVENDNARYSPIYTGNDTNVSFSYSPNESVFLVVVGTPKEYAYIDLNDPYNADYDYPYKYKVDIDNSCLIFLSPCDDKNQCTINDVYDANCECNGELNSSASFDIPFVSVNPNLDGWENFTGQTVYVEDGEILGLSWAGTSSISSWIAPDGSILSTGITHYQSNFQASDTGEYMLVAFDNLGCNSDTVKINVQLLCPTAGQACNDNNPLTSNDSYNSFCVCEGDLGFKISFEAMLEGFIQSDGNMLTKLNQLNLIPNNQPFTTSPWFYNGTESISNIPTNMVDWLLVNIFDANENILDTKAVLLYNDGIIYNNQFNTDIQFVANPNDVKYISLHHKSHLAIVANIPDLSQNTHINFTDDGIVLGVNQTKNVYANETMICGDYDGNGLINNLDYNKWNSNNSALNAYLPHDGDGNGIINNLDYNRWQLNRSKVGEPLIQF